MMEDFIILEGFIFLACIDLFGVEVQIFLSSSRNTEHKSSFIIHSLCKQR